MFSIKNQPHKFKQFFTNWAITLVTFVICLLIVEVVYRLQLIDFYKPEITLLNNLTKDKKSKKKVLVFGDSFTASLNNYVTFLNDRFPEIQFINSAMPGIGAQEINVIAKNRITEFNPEMVIVQFYVGNDLLDIKKPINWSNISFARNCYWLLSNHLYSWRFINYRLGQFKSNIGQSVESEQLKNYDSFSFDKFSKREKLLLSADAFYYDKSIHVSDDFKERYEVFIANVNDVIELCKSKKIALKIVIIPASCQVNERYKINLKKMGARFKHTAINDTIYPFIKQLTEKMYGNSTQILNPLVTFQKAESIGTRLYFENDIHLNKNGDSVLAQFIGNHLEK